MVIKDKKGKPRRLVVGMLATLLSVDAILSVEPGDK
jgi:hypothetical protein